VIPGMLDQFDCPSMLRLAAGRPMLILGGELDPNCPIEGAQIAIKEAKEAYRKGGAGDKLKVMIAPGVKHQVTQEQRQAALDWFEKWLK
jgi:predicted esterase